MAEPVQPIPTKLMRDAPWEVLANYSIDEPDAAREWLRGIPSVLRLAAQIALDDTSPYQSALLSDLHRRGLTPRDLLILAENLCERVDITTPSLALEDFRLELDAYLPERFDEDVTDG